MEDVKFAVGNKVVGEFYMGVIRIGTVINITDKRKDVVVDFGNFKETYRCDGYQRGGDAFTRSHITLLTPEIEQEIKDHKLILKCRKTFEKYKLTADQAARILEILNENKE